MQKLHERSYGQISSGRTITMRRIAATIMSLICFFSLTGCKDVLQQPNIQSVSAVTEVTTALTEQITEIETTTTIHAPTYQEKVVQSPVSMEMPTEIWIQAEDCVLSEALHVENAYNGYTGSGYVVGLSGNVQNTLVFSTTVPASQHYDVSVMLAADSDAECQVKIDDRIYHTLSVSGTGKFIQATMQNIYLEAGSHTIIIQQISGETWIDSLLLQNSEKMEVSNVSATLCDADATPEAKQLMQFLTEQYGNKLISGQYVSGSENEELMQIYQITGQLPVIRFDDLASKDAAASSLAWAEQGGIVGLAWYWNAPMGISSVYSDETDFSLINAVTNVDVAVCNQSELQQLQKDGLITEECVALIKDIDKGAKTLKLLQEANVPVLWRPLHEASNQWFWWGASGSEAYQWLWNLMYTRMTEYHQLHNLIWVWNGQSTDYLVPETQFDIASADIYLDAEDDFGSRYEQFFALQQLTENKLVALSECSTIPDLSEILRDNSVWSFFGLWYGEYLMDETAGYTTKQQMIDVYNSDLVMTLSEYRAWYAPKTK